MERTTNSASTQVTTRHRATVAIGFATGLLSGIGSRGIDCTEILRSVGISADAFAAPESRVPIDSYAALYNHVVQEFRDEGFSLFAAAVPLGSFEFLCRSMINSRSLFEALQRGARFLHMVLPDLVVEISREQGSAELRITESRPLQSSRDDPRRVFAFEWILRLLHGVACWMACREISLNSVTFPYSRPMHADDYDLIYTARSLFGGRELVATMNANLLDLPIRRDDKALSSFLDGAPGKITTLYRRDREMVHRVRDIVAERLPISASLDDVAHVMNLSPRTLHRRLHEEGSSLRAIKDALRRDIALSRLEKTNQPIADIASDLGYADPSTFYRAFLSWTGEAPTTYRDRLVGSR